MSNNESEKEVAVLKALSNLMSKGKLYNTSATSFVAHSAEKQKIEPTTECKLPSRHLVLSSDLIITDLSDAEQDIEDEYSFILNTPSTMRSYKIESCEQIDDVIIKFSNTIYGNFCIDELSENFNKEQLVNTFTRSKIVGSLINSFGYMSVDGITPSDMKARVFNRLKSSQPHRMLTRTDHSKVFILKIGDMTVSKGCLVEPMGQFLVFSTDLKNWTSQVFLCYAKINMDLLESSELYRSNVANVLVDVDNLNSSRYIGAVLEEDVASRAKKIDIPFAEPLAVSVKNITKLA